MPSVVPLDAGEVGIGHVEWAGFIGENAVFASVEGQLHVLGEGHKILEVHDGLLAAKPTLDGKSLITSGEDGLVMRLDDRLQVTRVFHEKGKWIDRLATGPANVIGFAWGKNGIVLNEKGDAKPFDCERSIEGLAFAPKGLRLALARYNGVDLKWVNTSNPAQFLQWAGAHTDVSFSPDGKYVVSTMQENALHGWRLADDKHMKMTGYPAKIKSTSWSAKGKWLASSGAPAAIVWPFAGKDGPMGKGPKELGAMGNIMVSHVCCHPSEDVVAIGYVNGMVAAVRIDDGKDAMLRRGGEGAISCLNWDKSGKRLAFGSENGEAGIVDISS